MNFRDSQNKVIDRAIDEATAQVPVRVAIQNAAQTSNIDGGALPVSATPRRGPLLCGITPIGEGYLSSDGE